MNSDQVEGRWKELKGSFRKKWGEFTDDEVEQMKGTRDELAGKLQQRYGYTREQAEKHFDDWLTAEESTPRTRTSGGY